MAKAFPRAALVLTIVTVISIPFFHGCGGKSPDEVVATFNGEPLTLGYFEAKWAKLALNDPKFEPDPDNSAKMDSLRREVLDVIINKELIVDQAVQRKFVEDETYLEAFDNQMEYRLIELLKNRQILAKIPKFTEDDYLAHYQQLGYKVKARHIDMDDEEEAKDLVTRLRNEEISFADAVTQYSTHPDRDMGGDLGVVSFGSNIKPVEEAIFSMEAGDISDPVKTLYGNSIFIVDHKAYEEPAEYASVRASIINRLQMRAMREIGAQHARDVMDKYGFEFNWDTAEIIMNYLPDDPTPSQLRDARTTTQEKPILKFTAEELKETLYEVEGKAYSLKDFSDEYDRLHPVARPMKSSRLTGIYNWVHKDVVGQLMPKEAIRLGLDKDPEITVALKEFQEQSCIGAVRRAVVDAFIDIGEEDVRQWYDENPMYYTLMPQVSCKQIINAEEEKILEAYQLLQEGVEVDSIGAKLSVAYPRQWVSEYFTADSTRYPNNVAMKHVQKLDKVGDYTPPFNYQGYWGIMVLHEKKSERLMDYEEARERAERDLRELRSSTRLDSLLDEWRGEADIVINEKVLRKAEKGPTPMPTQVQPGQSRS